MLFLLLLSVFSQLNAFHVGPSFRVSPFHNSHVLKSTEEAASLNADSSAPDLYQLFVGNLPFDVEEAALTDVISSRLGDRYEAIKIAKDRRTGNSRGFGYIHFDEKEKMESSLEALSGIEIGGRELRIDVAENRKSRPALARAPQENSVFIGNLNFDVTSSDIEQLCNDMLGDSSAHRVRLASDRETGRSRGFGHIDFNFPEDAKRAIEVLNGIEVMGRAIKVDHAQRRDPSEPRAPRSSRENSVFLGNLAWDVSQEMCIEMLTDVLGPDGGFTSVRLATDRETGRPRGFGHIDFKDRESAERAIAELNGMEVLGRLLRVDFAQRKESTPRPRSGGFDAPPSY